MMRQLALSKPLFALAALCGLAAAPIPAIAQSGGERVYVDLGRWTIYERGRSQNCVLRSAAQGAVSVAYFQAGTAPAQLNVQTARASVFVGDIVIAFDDAEFPASLVSQAVYAPLSQSSEVETAFRQARSLSVRHGDITVAQMSLQTSSAGLRLLKQCAEQGRIGMLPGLARATQSAQSPNSAPAPSIATRTTNNTPPPPSLARNPVPTNRDRWVRQNDYSRFNPGIWGGGVLEFTLVVDARGQPGDCIVNTSSGSRDFDALTCRNLQRRARFDPALDARGEASVGRYSGSIAYEVAE